MNKIVPSFAEAIADIPDGATIVFGGFAARGVPPGLVLALRDRNLKDLTVIRIDASGGWKYPIDVDLLIAAGQVKKVITSFPAFGSPKKVSACEQKVLEGLCEVEIVPQGTLAERVRAGGAGIGGFYTPVGVGTEEEQGKEVREFGGHKMILETALTADYALVFAHKADRYGNLAYRYASRNLNPLAAAAARTTIAEAEHIVDVGGIGPDEVDTPCIFVHRVVQSQGRGL